MKMRDSLGVCALDQSLDFKFKLLNKQADNLKEA